MSNSNSHFKVVKLATMALLTAAIFVLQFVTVPLGAITVSLSMVPVAVAAVIYMFIKKKKNYDTKGVPKLREDPKEKEGSSDNNK